MQKYISIILFALILVAPISSSFSQETVPAETREVVSEPKFKTQLLSAIQEARKNGDISRVQALRLRIACMSPAFVQQAQEVAVVQMVFSGQSPELIPYHTDGRVNMEGIDWDGLTAFLQAILPILLELLRSFGLGS